MNETTRTTRHWPNHAPQTTPREKPSELAATCLSLMSVLARLAAQKELLEAEQLLSAPYDDVAALLETVRTLRHDCDDIARALRIARPRTMLEVARRYDALLAHAIAADPDEFVLSTLPVSTAVGFQASVAE